mmetsp:Transcript_13761/g.33025  ORF Transcript_13761/g.33025 Transcript_13761/m.33025 type:complete len:87 (+) Transcript_13761:152-412(+)
MVPRGLHPKRSNWKKAIERNSWKQGNQAHSLPLPNASTGQRDDFYLKMDKIELCGCGRIYHWQLPRKSSSFSSRSPSSNQGARDGT